MEGLFLRLWIMVLDIFYQFDILHPIRTGLVNYGFSVCDKKAFLQKGALLFYHAGGFFVWIVQLDSIEIDMSWGCDIGC